LILIARKKKNCLDCERITYIYAKGLCATCYSYKQNKKLKEKLRGKKEKSASIQQRPGEDTSEGRAEKTEGELFNEIWNERPHVSEIDGTVLLPKTHKLWAWQFSHLLPKGLYNKARLDKENIVLKTWAQHQLWEFHAHKLRDKEEWKWVFEKRERLKREYHADF